MSKISEIIVVSTIMLGGSLFLNANIDFRTHAMESNRLEAKAQLMYSDTLYYMIQKQEKVLGIKHYGMPNLTTFDKDTTLGHYTAALDKMALLNDIRQYEGELETSIAHELGHYYADKVSESIGMGDWPVYKKSNFASKKLISEGIATYFQFRTVGFDKVDRYAFQIVRDFDDITNTLKNNSHYITGYAFVMPILDMDVHKGVEYLIRNPLSSDDDKVEYQKRAIYHLALATKK